MSSPNVHLVLLYYHEQFPVRQRYVFTVGQVVAYPVEFRCLVSRSDSGSYVVDLAEPLHPIPALISREQQVVRQLICQVLEQRLGAKVVVRKGALAEYHGDIAGEEFREHEKPGLEGCRDVMPMRRREPPENGICLRYSGHPGFHSDHRGTRWSYIGHDV